MNRVSKTIFRSLLRWNRANAASKVPFSLRTSQLGLDTVTVGSLPLPATIESNETLQGLLFHCFRTLPASAENLDRGFQAVKLLNDHGVLLREKGLQRKVHSSELFLKHATFKVGQVVANRFTKVRGVVVGWEVDEVRGTQRVELLTDTLDFKEFIGTRGPVFSKLVDSEHLELVTDKHLQRIHNSEVNALFYYFDEASGRYVPKPDLAFRYPADSAGVVFSNPLLCEENRRSMKSVVSGVTTLGQHLQVIVDEYFPRLVDDFYAKRQQRSPSSSSSSPSSSSSLFQDNRERSDKELNELAIAEQILQELLGRIDSMVSPHPSLRTTTAATDEEATKSFSQRILRGPAVLKKLQEKTGTEFEQFDFKEEDQVEIETAYGAIFSFTEFLTSLHQLLQLRFQSKGIAFSDRLRVSHDNPSSSPQVELLPLHEDVAAIDNQSLQPVAVYSVGTVVRHKKYGYRGVISGYDHRPLLDVSKWDGVRHLQLKAEQPFYRVIPDQQDTESFLGEGIHRPYFYVAQENIEVVQEEEQMLISHRHIPQFFLGWDSAGKRFRLPHQLRYCFPAEHHAFPADYPKTSVLQQWQEKTLSSSTISKSAEEAALITEEIEVYEKIDKLLLELSGQAKLVLGDVREQHVMYGSSRNREEDAHLLFTVPDLFNLLKLAPSREAALPVESLCWHVWTCFTDPDISTLLRQGMSYMKREDRTNAVACYKLATQIAPQFAEPHNKLAAIYHAMNMHEDCLRSATLALQYFPEHYGALAGQGLSYEKLGQEDKAIECIRKSLSLHPHAANLPTVLQSILTMPKPTQDNTDEKTDN